MEPFYSISLRRSSMEYYLQNMLETIAENNELLGLLDKNMKNPVLFIRYPTFDQALSSFRQPYSLDVNGVSALYRFLEGRKKVLAHSFYWADRKGLLVAYIEDINCYACTPFFR